MRGTNWQEARKALKRLATVAAKYDPDGIEIHFLNSKRTLTTSDPQKIRELFDSVKPSKATPLGGKLQELLFEYMKDMTSTSTKKKVNYIVITDGVPTDNPMTKDGIIRAARRLDELQLPTHQIGIQFVQVGREKDAAAFLQALDDDLSKPKPGETKIRDMVDTTIAKKNEPLDLIKVFLGAINRRVDLNGSSVLSG
ncbi:hypothetical protein DXG01_017004 [Tephrocybe rancida]|nr:hypothetical protein DXG01_017004 [Tephrocybe rancida]